MERRRDRDDSVNDRHLRRALDEGSWIRVVPGVFVAGDEWRRLTPLERHRARVYEALGRTHRPVVVSHHAAAAIWGIDVFGLWPERIDVTRDAASGGRSSGVFRRRTRDLDGLETVPLGIHGVTSPAQTAVDLARIERFLPAVAVVDQAIWSDRIGGPLTDREAVLGRLDADPGHRGDARARRAIEFAQPLAANVRESQSRVVISRLGFPSPRLQERRVLRSGRVVYADLYFPDHDHWCEVDGRVKYTEPAFLDGRTPAQAVIDEKNRENEIRREVRAFSRWEASAADRPRELWDILTRAGLPSSRPRP